LSRRGRLALVGLCLALAASRAVADDAVPPGMVITRSEAKLLKQYPGIAKRNGDHLRIETQDGKGLSFTSTCPLEETTETKDCVQFALVNYDPAGDIAVVAEQRYEAHKALAIDRKTGAKIELADMPHIAPDGRMLAVVKDDQENVELIVQAIRHDSGGFKIAGDNLDTEVCAFESWQADDSFLIVCGDDAEENFREKHVARGTNGKWAATPTGRTRTGDDFNALSQMQYGDAE
jgi:hypothetical protein